jgi:hypothetical protein
MPSTSFGWPEGLPDWPGTNRVLGFAGLTGLEGPSLAALGSCSAPVSRSQLTGKAQFPIIDQLKRAYQQRDDMAG